MIEGGDQRKLENYFDRSNPQTLQEEAWHIFVYHFGGVRRREGIEEMEKHARATQCSYLQHREGKLPGAVYKTVPIEI